MGQTLQARAIEQILNFESGAQALIVQYTALKLREQMREICDAIPR